MGFFSKLIGMARGSSTPATGEATGAQSDNKGPTGAGGGTFSAINSVPGFPKTPSGSYAIYEQISIHPTVVEVISLVYGPIEANHWGWEAKEGTPQKIIDAVEQYMGALRDSAMKALRALEFGCWKFEKVWEEKDGLLVIDELKELDVDNKKTEILVDDTGKFAGFKTKKGQEDVFLDPPKAWIYTCTDGAKPGDLHGHARNENIRKDWARSEANAEKLGQYLQKIAGIITTMHYPDGTSKDAAGADRPNFELARNILAAAARGESIALPNKFASFLSGDDGMVSAAVLEKALAAAGKSEWVIDHLDPGGTDFSGGILEVLAYWDKRMFRGWHRPERTGLEATTSGSRADSQSHSDNSSQDCEGIERKICKSFNESVVDDFITVNWGEKYRGAVVAVPNPIADDAESSARELINDALANPVLAPIIARKIKWDALLTDADIPAEEGEEGAVGDELNAAAQAAAKAKQPPAAPPDVAGDTTLTRLSRALLDGDGIDLDRDDELRDEHGRWTAGGLTIHPYAVELTNQEKTLADYYFTKKGLKPTATPDERKEVVRAAQAKGKGVPPVVLKAVGMTAQNMSVGDEVVYLSAAELTGGEWRTINGAKVYIKDGVAIAGPSHLVGKDHAGIEAHGKTTAAHKEGFHRINRDAKGGYAGTQDKSGNVSHVPEHAARMKEIGAKLSPGYTGAHLNADPHAEMQAVGIDSKGRPQYKYSDAHNEDAKAGKFARGKEFNKQLPKIRERLAADAAKGVEEAHALRLIDHTGFRVGGEKDTGAEKQAYGATTLEASHVKTDGDKTKVEFVGKKGVDNSHEIHDPEVAADLNKRAKSGGKLYNTNDAKVRDYLKKVAPGFKVKDFRTAVAFRTAGKAIEGMPAPASVKDFIAARGKVGEIVSQKLGNTADVALKDYIDPTVFNKWTTKIANTEQAGLIAAHAQATGLTENEAAKDWITKNAKAYREDFNKRISKNAPRSKNAA